MHLTWGKPGYKEKQARDQTDQRQRGVSAKCLKAPNRASRRNPIRFLYDTCVWLVGRRLSHFCDKAVTTARLGQDVFLVFGVISEHLTQHGDDDGKAVLLNHRIGPQLLHQVGLL